MKKFIFFSCAFVVAAIPFVFGKLFVSELKQVCQELAIPPTDIRNPVWGHLYDAIGGIYNQRFYSQFIEAKLDDYNTWESIRSYRKDEAKQPKGEALVALFPSNGGTVGHSVENSSNIGKIFRGMSEYYQNESIPHQGAIFMAHLFNILVTGSPYPDQQQSAKKQKIETMLESSVQQVKSEIIKIKTSTTYLAQIDERTFLRKLKSLQSYAMTLWNERNSKLDGIKQPKIPADIQLDRESWEFLFLLHSFALYAFDSPGEMKNYLENLQSSLGDECLAIRFLPVHSEKDPPKKRSKKNQTQPETGSEEFDFYNAIELVENPFFVWSFRRLPIGQSSALYWNRAQSVHIPGKWLPDCAESVLLNLCNCLLWNPMEKRPTTEHLGGMSLADDLMRFYQKYPNPYVGSKELRNDWSKVVQDLPHLPANLFRIRYKSRKDLPEDTPCGNEIYSGIINMINVLLQIFGIPQSEFWSEDCPIVQIFAKNSGMEFDENQTVEWLQKNLEILLSRLVDPTINCIIGVEVRWIKKNLVDLEGKIDISFSYEALGNAKISVLHVPGHATFNLLKIESFGSQFELKNLPKIGDGKASEFVDHFPWLVFDRYFKVADFKKTINSDGGSLYEHLMYTQPIDNDQFRREACKALSNLIGFKNNQINSSIGLPKIMNNLIIGAIQTAPQDPILWKKFSKYFPFIKKTIEFENIPIRIAVESMNLLGNYQNMEKLANRLIQCSPNTVFSILQFIDKTWKNLANDPNKEKVLIQNLERLFENTFNEQFLIEFFGFLFGKINQKIATQHKINREEIFSDWMFDFMMGFFVQRVSRQVVENKMFFELVQIAIYMNQSKFLDYVLFSKNGSNLEQVQFFPIMKMIMGFPQIHQMRLCLEMKRSIWFEKLQDIQFLNAKNPALMITRESTVFDVVFFCIGRLDWLSLKFGLPAIDGRVGEKILNAFFGEFGHSEEIGEVLASSIVFDLKNEEIWFQQFVRRIEDMKLIITNPSPAMQKFLSYF